MLKGIEFLRKNSRVFKISSHTLSSLRVKRSNLVTLQRTLSSFLRCARNDDRQGEVGRSMIEMLGVLAIIGVLSVGGIAGYSKAMEKFKINKLLYEYNTLIMGLLEHRESIVKSISGKSGVQYLTQFTAAANIAPTNWKLQSNYFKDSWNNEVYPYAEITDNIANDMKRVGVIIWFNRTPDKSIKTQKLCVEMFNNLIIPLKSFVQRGYVFKNNQNLSDTLYMGDKYCQSNSKCLRDMTLSDIHNVCSDCDGNANCRMIISF